MLKLGLKSSVILPKESTIFKWQILLVELVLIVGKGKTNDLRVIFSKFTFIDLKIDIFLQIRRIIC